MEARWFCVPGTGWAVPRRQTKEVNSTRGWAAQGDNTVLGLFVVDRISRLRILGLDGPVDL